MNQDITPYIKFLLEIQKPDLEGVWLDGKHCAEHDLSLSENPFKQGTKEFLYWNEGWWEGFYGLDLNVADELTENSLANAANDPIYDKGRKLLDWFEDMSFVLSTFVAGFMVYELVDIAI